MKKTMLFLLFCAVCFGVTGCHDPSPASYPDAALESVVEVELIHYNSETIRPFQFDRAETIQALDPERLDGFWDDLSRMTMWNRPNSGAYVGRCIRIAYSSGDFDVVSCNNEEHRIISFVARYKSKGKLLGLLGNVEDKGEYESIIDTYFFPQME